MTATDVSLYQLTSRVLELDNKLESIEICTKQGELIDASLDGFRDLLTQKVDNVVDYINFLNDRAEALKLREKAFADKRRLEENKVERLKAYIKASMEAGELAALEGKTCKISLSNTAPIVEITDRDQLPMEFVAVVQEYKVDKKAIAIAIKAGKEVKGAKLVENKALRIK
jgi:hypothetical protein